MLQLCAWCHQLIAPGTEPASYGICNDCLQRILNERPKPVAP